MKTVLFGSHKESYRSWCWWYSFICVYIYVYIYMYALSLKFFFVFDVNVIKKAFPAWCFRVFAFLLHHYYRKFFIVHKCSFYQRMLRLCLFRHRQWYFFLSRIECYINNSRSTTQVHRKKGKKTYSTSSHQT